MNSSTALKIGVEKSANMGKWKNQKITIFFAGLMAAAAKYPPVPPSVSVRDGWRCRGKLPMARRLTAGCMGRYGAGHRGHDQRGRRAESSSLGKGRAKRDEGATMSRRDTGRGSHSESCNESVNRARHWSLAGRLAKRPIA